jgi:hypothetical protein
MRDFRGQEIFLARTVARGHGVKIKNFEKEKYCFALGAGV